MRDTHELEVYSPIEGFNDYLITSQGRVLSLKYGKLKELNQVNDGHGYYYVNLSKNGKPYNKKVHRLVAQAFIVNPDNKPCINHIDENKTNNHASNLEWCTYKENNNHGTHNERMSKTLGDGRRKGSKHDNARAVLGFKIKGCGMKYYTYVSECEKDGFNPSGISQCCRNTIKSYKGFKWFYADEFFNRKDDKQ